MFRGLLNLKNVCFETGLCACMDACVCICVGVHASECVDHHFESLDYHISGTKKCRTTKFYVCPFKLSYIKEKAELDNFNVLS